jgi:hypothetical protein
MATTRSTRRWRGQKSNVCGISALQENCSHRRRRKTAMPEATFWVFSFIFHLFTTNVTRALPLEAIKREAGATSRKREKKASDQTTTHRSNQIEHTSLRHRHIHHPSQETWDPLSLSKACNSYYEHSGARQHEQQQNPLDVGPFMPEPVYILVSALHTI